MPGYGGGGSNFSKQDAKLCRRIFWAEVPALQLQDNLLAAEVAEAQVHKGLEETAVMDLPAALEETDLMEVLIRLLEEVVEELAILMVMVAMEDPVPSGYLYIIY